MSKIYTVKETAKILGFSTNTVYKYLDEGRIKAARGQEQGRFRITQQSIEDFLGQPLSREEVEISIPSATFPLKLSRILIAFSLLFIIYDALTTSSFNILEQLFRVITLGIFFILAYQFGGFKRKQANT